MAKQYITGFGQVSHLGKNSEEALRRLKAPSEEYTIKALPKLSPSEPFVGQTIELPEDKDVPEEQSLAIRLSILAIKEALKKANITATEIQRLKIGICLGSTSACATCDYEFAKIYHRQPVEDFKVFDKTFQNNPALAIARHFQFNGPVLSINNACTAGADAIGIGSSWIRQGLCDLVIAGGVDVILENIYFGFHSLGLLASEQVLPFDKNRDGLVLGDAAGFVVLEAQSLKRDCNPYCELLGYGLATDAFHPTSPHPEARGLSLAVDQALKAAGIGRSAVDLINAHATGTPANDQVEGKYLFKNFPATPIFATKPYTGHSLGAAGALEAIWGVLCIQENFIPATLGYGDFDPEIQISPNQTVREHKTSTYLSTSLGFGGSNAALLLGRLK